MIKPDSIVKIDTSILNDREVDWEKIGAYLYLYRGVEAGRYFNGNY